MSRETKQFLNENTLIGFTEKRRQDKNHYGTDGHAWHWDGVTQNHYEGPIPFEDAQAFFRRWHPVIGQFTATALTEDGVLTAVDSERIAILRSDTGEILGRPSTAYGLHPYEETVLNKVTQIVDDDLGIASCIYLRNGAQAAIQLEMPESVTGPGEFVFRPFLTATSSYDSTLPSEYGKGLEAWVCDNTLSIARSNFQAKTRIKHTRHSLARVKVLDLREALGIVHDIADDFTTELDALLSEHVTNDRFGRWVDEFSGYNAVADQPEGRGKTLARNKQDALWDLWMKDDRVEPWKNTALGVLQAGNTWAHHIQTVKGASREERNMSRRLTGDFDKVDTQILATLAAV